MSIHGAYIILLVHSFQRMHRILSALAANPFVRISEDDLFSELNRLYILSHTTFFELIELEDTELEGLKKAIYSTGFDEFDTLERFIEMQDLNLLADYLRQNVDPIAAEISKLAVAHRITSNTYSGNLGTKTLEENLEIAGKLYEHLAAMDVGTVDYAKESEEAGELQKIIWQQVFDDQLEKLLTAYKQRVSEYSRKSFPEPEWLVLDTENGKVFLDWVFVWAIRLGTREFSFFKTLYDNKGRALSHEEIAKWLEGLSANSGHGINKISKTLSSYLSDIKRLLPKEVRSLIISSKQSYMIR